MARALLEPLCQECREEFPSGDDSHVWTSLGSGEDKQDDIIDE